MTTNISIFITIVVFIYSAYRIAFLHKNDIDNYDKRGFWKSIFGSDKDPRDDNMKILLSILSLFILTVIYLYIA